ncbi:hypothetical protein PBI_TEAMOCIL_52 [Microbacterium phage Teamocil]|uniref:Uncharacterized protein n=1 Tax=Microbacterium phage Teamocil TaxID=2656554 RepID=A0A649VZP3_9CAUD|nr:hypothetical protein QDA12_gp52 [Microbacterium phage Teamocil]QGJ88906.1 hypothetical protein PBI_GINA_52 [Microbacterium phage Gina]QGJ97003.1 hypothetical protein PBI_TEAMOCIL_52 [Microbacterium phage Teamocil]
MSADLPEGVSTADVRGHAISLSIVGTLVNLTGLYLNAEDGTTAEAEAETELDEFLERVVQMGPEVAGRALLVFASLITQAGDEATVQAWFDDQGQHIATALAQEESGD